MIFAIEIVREFQAVNGQNGSSMVDKLIEDTKIEQSYRAELINRIENSTCLNEYNNNTLIDYWFTYDLEDQLKKCVEKGIIK